MNRDNLKNKLNLYIIAVLTIALSGEVYFFPFQDAFRFSAGVIALSLILLVYDDLETVNVAFFAGISIFILRGIIYSIDGDYSFSDLIRINLPASIYYLSYGLLFNFFKVKNNTHSPALCINLLALTDIGANIIEALIRTNLSSSLMTYIIIVALARSSMIFITYRLSKRKELLIKREEHQKKYNQLNTLISNLQAEIFYLNKSTADIESVMSKAYTLYEKTKDNNEIRQLSLDVAREVHEIKKDYQRVISGFKTYVNDFDFDKTMSLKDIGSIIESNLERYINYHRKDIQVTIDFQDNLHIKNYYYLFTIINNLITNAIDAIVDKGKIHVEGKTIGDDLVLRVKDDGPGIDEEIKPHIFNPGFTTKFDASTGIQSTGIGLSHVEYIVKSLKGSIEVKSKINKGTTFTVIIPKESLRR